MLLIAVAAMIFFVTIKILTTDYSDFKPVVINHKKNGKSLRKICENIDTVTVDNFPYEQYLNNINYTDINVINKNITELDSLTKNSFLTQNILLKALTDNVLAQLDTNNPDSLNVILNIADEYKVYAKFNEERNSFYLSLHDFWYNYTSKRISDLIKQNYIGKYDFKYRYLTQKCSDNGYLKNEKYSLTEKAFFNIIDSNWSYLFNRFWFATNIYFKIAVFLLLSLFLTAAFFTLKCLIRK